MARYIDADALYKETEKKIAEANSYRMAVVDREFLDIINDAFTADVVPKSEVAREIFEELDKALAYCLESHPYAIERYNEIRNNYIKRGEYESN